MNVSILRRKAGKAGGWAVLGSSAAVGRTIWSLNRDLRGLLGPSPREEDRRRLALDADQLESILEERRKVSDQFEHELSRVIAKPRGSANASTKTSRNGGKKTSTTRED